MFNRKAVSSLKVNNENQDTPRCRFLLRRQVSQPSPANRFLSLLKSGLKPSEKLSKSGWTPNLSRKPSNSNGSSPGATTTATNDSKDEPSSSTSIISPSSSLSPQSESGIPTGTDDSKEKSSLGTSNVSSSSLLSPQSGIGISNLPGWAKTTEVESGSFGDQDQSPIPPSLPPTPPTPTFSPMETVTNRCCLFPCQDEMGSPYHADVSQNSQPDISLDGSHYDFDLNHHYDFDLDDDLATERNRYQKGKSIHIDGVEMTAEEEEFTKSFNRIKLNRRPRRANRRKLKKSTSVSGKKNDLFKIEDNA